MVHERETDARERLSVKTHRKIYVTSLSRNWGRKCKKKKKNVEKKVPNVGTVM